MNLEWKSNASGKTSMANEQTQTYLVVGALPHGHRAGVCGDRKGSNCMVREKAYD